MDDAYAIGLDLPCYLGALADRRAGIAAQKAANRQARLGVKDDGECQTGDLDGAGAGAQEVQVEYVGDGQNGSVEMRVRPSAGRGVLSHDDRRDSHISAV